MDIDSDVVHVSKKTIIGCCIIITIIEKLRRKYATNSLSQPCYLPNIQFWTIVWCDKIIKYDNAIKQ